MAASSIFLTTSISQKTPRFFSNLRSLGRRLSRFKVLEPLRPLARGIVYTTEPAGQLWVSDAPAMRTHEQSEAITVISANLRHDFPHYRHISERLDAFIQIVEKENANILLLQEVARTPFLQANERLSQRLNMAYVYSRANGHHGAIGFEEGLAVFSRYPLEKLSLQQLGANWNPFVRRLVLGATVDTPFGELFVFSTHLSISPRQNTLQMRHLQNWVKETTQGRPAIIGGDFNAHETRLSIKHVQLGWMDTFRQLNPEADGTTHELQGPLGKFWPRHRLDYIFLQPGNQRWQVIESNHLYNPKIPHSDHQAILTRLLPG